MLVLSHDAPDLEILRIEITEEAGKKLKKRRREKYALEKYYKKCSRPKELIHAEFKKDRRRFVTR